MAITINSNIESNYEISVCNRCKKEYYTIYYEQHGCTCLSEKERNKIEKKKENWRNMQARAAEKARLKRLELKGNKTPVYQNKATQKPIKQISEKQKAINAAMSEMKRDIVEHAINTNQYYCHGCNVETLRLDCSHKLSIAQRPDLALKKKNITLLCRKCHVIWEGWDISKMIELNCFIEDLEYIYKKDSETFNKILFKLLDHFNKYPYPSTAKILKKIEQFDEIEVEA